VVVKLAMNLLLVPLIGIAGAALATLVAVTAQAVIQNRSLPRSLGPERPSWRLVGLCILVSTAAAATVVLPQTMEWNIARFALGLLCLPWFFARLTELRRSGNRSAAAADHEPSRVDDGVEQPTAMSTTQE
jgi:O-antigen/teichoic acid export membrane protein